jgi:hypothetical protein
MLEIRVHHRRGKAEIHWHSSQFSTYPTMEPAATRCSLHSKPLTVKLWALTALRKQSHFYSSCTQLLSSCSITGRENGPVSSWCEAYGRFGQVFRSSCSAVNRLGRCHQEWRPAEFTCTIWNSRAKSLSLRCGGCGVCCLRRGHAQMSTIGFIVAPREC